MKNIILISMLTLATIGCTAEQWASLNNRATKVSSGSTAVATVAEKSAVVTGIYGETLSIIALGVGSIAAGIAGFAAKKAKKSE